MASYRFKYCGRPVNMLIETMLILLQCQGEVTVLRASPLLGR